MTNDLSCEKSDGEVGGDRNRGREGSLDSWANSIHFLFFFSKSSFFALTVEAFV